MECYTSETSCVKSLAFLGDKWRLIILGEVIESFGGSQKLQKLDHCSTSGIWTKLAVLKWPRCLRGLLRKWILSAKVNSSILTSIFVQESSPVGV